MQKKWIIKTPHPKRQIELSDSLNIHPILAQILINRGIDTIKEAKGFLDCDFSHLHDPFLLKDMDRAIERIKKAQKNNETVLIFGDYDVDGITSSVLLKNLLKKLGIHTINYIPHRMQEGYGLNHGIVNICRANGTKLLICVDCGISAHEEVEALTEAEIDTIIIDHHEPGRINSSLESIGKNRIFNVDSDAYLPNAIAVIDPKRPDCLYPFKGLASVGLVAKLSQALLGEIPEDTLDLIAIGTIADVAELRGENRIFVKHGLPKIIKTKNYGLKALLDVAKLTGKKFQPSYVGFILGPRLNATGRMGSALHSLDLLLTEDPQEALNLAHKLEEFNLLRQKTQNEIVEEALMIVDREINFRDHKVIVLNRPGWHKGVLGIVASRIMEKYYRPTIVISTQDGIGTGSARSIDGFHIFEALHSCRDSLENYGGHKKAAGLTVREDKIDFFRNAINQFAQEALQSVDLVPTLNLDIEIPLDTIDMPLTNAMESLEPFGEGNSAPVFCSRQLTVKTPGQTLGKDTLKFSVTAGQGTITAVGFGMGKFRDLVRIGNRLDLAYTLSIDDWKKEPIVVLKLKDIKETQDERVYS